jgi:hypothetical protein
MKKSKVLLGITTAMTVATSQCRGPVDLGQYLTGNYVDKKGRNLLQVLAKHSYDDNFTLSFKPFLLPQQIAQDNAVTFQKWKIILEIMPKELLPVIVMAEGLEMAKQLTEAKDNNGDTALDILNKKNSSHVRSQDLKEVLTSMKEDFEEMDRQKAAEQEREQQEQQEQELRERLGLGE